MIALGGGLIKLANSLANAQLGTYISLNDGGSGLWNMSVAGTSVIQNATVLDVPEFYEFLVQWIKMKCTVKEGDPRYESMVSELQSQRKQMVDTLTERIEDDDTEIQGDYSNYLELS